MMIGCDVDNDYDLFFYHSSGSIIPPDRTQSGGWGKSDDDRSIGMSSSNNYKKIKSINSYEGKINMNNMIVTLRNTKVQY